MADAPVLFCVGGAGGIGSACTRLFHARGWRVCILDLATSSGPALCAELCAAAPASALFHAVDVSMEASIAAAAAAAHAFSGGRCDALVVMSASFQYGEVHEVTEAQWEAVCATNLKGPALCIKAVLGGMRAARAGAIVLTSSITANTAFPAFVPYSATKAALQQMVRDVALDNGKFGVRCNCVAPGPIFTQGGTVAHAEKMGQPLEELCGQLAADVALRRMGTAEECAKAVYFLASSESAYITGTTLHVDGGFFRK
jgi:NAD(P)-dependent dehydrogenase (short-subunit alcohol dehydrogenase family)